MINLHNHTTYSDGHLGPEEIVQAALAAGLTHVGISDHFQTAKLGLTAQYVIVEEIEHYIKHIRALAERYAARITVLVGLEVDFSERTPLHQLWIKGYSRTPLNDLDYVLFEYVGDPEWTGLPLAALLAYRRWIRVPLGLAHNFLSRNFAPVMSPDKLVQTLERHKIFIELAPTNYYSVQSPLTGESIPYYRYPDPYNEALLAAFRNSHILFSIGTDTHSLVSEVSAVEDAWAFLKENGLTDRLVTQYYWSREPRLDVEVCK